MKQYFVAGDILGPDLEAGKDYGVYLAFEVEAEIEKARNEDTENWTAVCKANIEKARREEKQKLLSESLYDTARADERERIEDTYRRLRFDHLADDAFEIAIASRPTQEPKPLDNTFPILHAMESVQAIFQKAIGEIRHGKERKEGSS